MRDHFPTHSVASLNKAKKSSYKKRNIQTNISTNIDTKILNKILVSQNLWTKMDFDKSKSDSFI